MCARTEDSWITAVLAEDGAGPDDGPDEELPELRIAQPEEWTMTMAVAISFTASS